MKKLISNHPYISSALGILLIVGVIYFLYNSSEKSRIQKVLDSINLRMGDTKTPPAQLIQLRTQEKILSNQYSKL